MMVYPGGGYYGEYFPVFPTTTVVFRRTLSSVGTRVGSRQVVISLVFLAVCVWS